METITITDMKDIERIMKEPSDMKMKRGEDPISADYRIRLISGQDFTSLNLHSNYMSDGDQHYRISGENVLLDIIESLDYEWERTEF